MQSLKREAVLFDFFNGLEADGSPRVANFRYYKTDGTVSEKRNCTRSFEDVAKIAAEAKASKEAEVVKVDAKKRETPNLKSNFMIRIRFVNGETTEFRNLKIKLLTHYRPRGSAEWFEIIHPSR